MSFFFHIQSIIGLILLKDQKYNHLRVLTLHHIKQQLFTWTDQRQSKKMTNQLNVATLSVSKRGKTSLTVQCKHNAVSTDLHFTCLFVHSQNLRFVVSVPLHHTRSASCPLLNLLCSCHRIPSGFLPVHLDCLVFLHHLFF